MSRFKVIMATVVLTASIVLLFSKLFTPQPVQIILESGQEISTQSSELFSLYDMMLMISCSFLIGSTAIYLFFTQGTRDVIKSIRKDGGAEKGYEMLIPLLKGDEKGVFLEILRSKGEILQNELVLKLRLSKVKVTRVLSSLERKNLILKERYGLTNKIKLKR